MKKKSVSGLSIFLGIFVTTAMMAVCLFLAYQVVFAKQSSDINVIAQPKSVTFHQREERIPQVQGMTAVSDPAKSFDVRLPVLMYHYIRTMTDPRDGLGVGLSVSPEKFEAQMKFLNANQYQTITPSELAQALDNRNKLQAHSILLTFDDGYQDFYTQAFPILKKYNLRATVFVVSGFVSDTEGRYLTWDQIRELDQSGLITIAAHTATHALLTRSANAQSEIEESKKILEKFLGHPVSAFAYPYGAYNQSVANLVESAGFSLAFTTVEGVVLQSTQSFFLPRSRVFGGISLERFVEKVEMRKPGLSKEPNGQGF